MVNSCFQIYIIVYQLAYLEQAVISAGQFPLLPLPLDGGCVGDVCGGVVVPVHIRHCFRLTLVLLKEV
jgi:hypothetical protein